MIAAGMVVEASGGYSCSSYHEIAAGIVDGVCSSYMVPSAEVAVGSKYCTELVADWFHHCAAQGHHWGTLYFHGTSELLASSADFAASSC